MSRPKKSLGQHFLTDVSYVQRIADAVGDMAVYNKVVEIGPGPGALTTALLQQQPHNFYVVEIDDQLAAELPTKFPELEGKVIHEDFLKVDLAELCSYPLAVVGNFPYNISSQILFKIYEHRDLVELSVGMFQKEVARRAVASPGSKDYGILSVLLGAFYEGEYLFTVPPGAFYPPPKVDSGVIRLKRNNVKQLACDEVLFKKVVKQAFQQRRKMIRNSLRGFIRDTSLLEGELFTHRPEQLGVQDFIQLTQMISEQA